MKYKVGDRVSFLNERRDGIVRKIINKNMISVEIEDGFEIPVLENEVVPIVLPDHIQQKKTIYAAPESFFQKNTTEPEKTNQEEDKFEPINLLSKDLPAYGIYLAFIPENDKSPIADGINVYIINHTNYDVLFAVLLKKDKHWYYFDFDKCDEESMFKIQTIGNLQFDNWSEIQLQVMYFKAESQQIKQPENLFFKIHPQKFYRDGSFEYYHFINASCILVKPLSKQEKQEWDNNLEKQPKNIPGKNLKIIGHIDNYLKKEPFPAKHLIEKDVAEVDLHIDELVDNIEGLNNSEMLKTQIAYFRTCLNSAIIHKLRKIIFIHGVGNGKLKAEIQHVVQNEYPQVQMADAPMARYGVGATELTIIHT